MDKTNHLIQYKIFNSCAEILAFTTTKQVFKTKSPRFTGDSSDLFQNNREQLAVFLGIKTEQLVFPRQTHTNCVAEIKNIPENEMQETDALITNKKGICICIQTADCVPVLLFDPVKKVIAAIHSGWRGTVKNIVGIAISKMKNDYNVNPENILAAIGPSIGIDNYEVGDEVINAVRQNIPNAGKTIYKNKKGAHFLDLWEANKQIMLAAGLQLKNIETLGECSFAGNEKYYSARRDGIETGRTVSGIMLM